jgi:hypothetical protein
LSPSSQVSRGALGVLRTIFFKMPVISLGRVGVGRDGRGGCEGARCL